MLAPRLGVAGAFRFFTVEEEEDDTEASEWAAETFHSSVKDDEAEEGRERVVVNQVFLVSLAKAGGKWTLSTDAVSAFVGRQTFGEMAWMSEFQNGTDIVQKERRKKGITKEGGTLLKNENFVFLPK